MNKTEQGVLQQSKLARLLIHILLLFSFFLIQPASAEIPESAKILPADAPPHEKNTQKHHVFIIYSPDSTLHSNIIQKLSGDLNRKRSDIIITKLTPDEKTKTVDNKTDIVIGIGSAGIQSADKHYPNIKKLFISTAPNKYRLDRDKNKNDAILYMTQSYCRQIQFIKLLNTHWKTISILNSQKNPVDSSFIQQCANNYDINIYTVNTTLEENLTNKIKNALSHSDVLLALPDNNIYNSKTVKNILLTSYRHRKPVIAFSKNFVNAGALASVHSNTEQIAQSASKLIEQYFDSDKRFIKPINHPDAFDININRQVFRALDLSIPDMDKLKQSLQRPVQDNYVESL
jgi:ABC-type uncharacterized transport system substrate-binding protein